MSNPENVYKKEEFTTDSRLRIMFVSRGIKNIIKVVDYELIEESSNRKIYNLGFGDYDFATDTIDDRITTNNGDGKKVLNTILSTIPTFFKYYPGCIVIVRGSDSEPGYIENCRRTCTKCKDNHCRRAYRRINLYQKYLNSNFELLNNDYQFFGGYYDESGRKIEEEYIRGRKYFSVLLTEKNK